MSRLRSLILFGLLGLWIGGFADIAFAASIRAEASTQQIEPNGVFEWRVSLSGTSKNPKVNLGQFQLVGGPSTSTQFSIVNGQVSNSVELVYVLRAPAKPGTYTLPTASSDAGGQQIVSTAATIEVVDVPVSSTPNTGSQSRGQPQARQPQQASSAQAWIEASTSDKTVFVGERIHVVYRIFFQSARNLQITQLPQGSGYSMENAREIREYKVERTERNGRPVNSAVVMDVWITPTRAGTIEVPPLEAQIEVVQQVRRRNNDPFSIFNDPFSAFGNPFGDATIVPQSVKSQKVTITAKPLPGGGKSIDAWVGNFQATASISPQSVPVHQAATVLVNIKGGSQLKNLPIPELTVPGSLESYPAQSKTFGDGEQIRKEIRYPVIPRSPGRFALVFQSINSFDPSTQTYRKLLADTLWLTAEGAANGQTMMYAPRQPSTIFNGQDQLPVPMIERTDRPLFWLRMGWYLAIVLTIVGLLGMGWIRIKSGKTSQERSQYRGVKKRLFDKINTFTASTEVESEDIEHILSEYLSTTFKHPSGKITHPDQLAALTDPIASKWMELWQNLRELRYQPASLMEDAIAEWKKSALTLIQEKN